MRLPAGSGLWLLGYFPTALSRAAALLPPPSGRSVCMLFSSRRQTQKQPVRARRRPLVVECLEDRVLLTVVPAVTGSTVLFTGAASDNLFLQTTAAGLLQYHDSSTTSFTSVLAGGKPFNLQ